MHKPFYASGFLFHLATQQILLQQPIVAGNSTPSWNLFGGTSRPGEEAATTFQRIMQDRLHLTLKTKHILPVYDYFDEALHQNHYVFYVEIKKLQTFAPRPTEIFSWFTFKQTTKLGLTPQAKQNIIIAERVIKALARSKEPPPPLRPGQRAGLYH